MKKYTGVALSFLVFLTTLLITGCTPTDAVSFLDKVTGIVGGWGGFSAIIAGVIEIIVRLIPSVNPQSLFLVLSEVLHSLGNAVGALSKFIDGLGLQNAKSLKEPGIKQ